MAAKKKPAYQDASKKNRATTKDKPKSNGPSAAQIAALKGPTSTKKPTEAITAPGQKATGLAKSTVKGNRFSSTAKTPVYKAQQGLRGTGGSLTSALGYKPTKMNIVNAALTATGGASVAKSVASRIGKTVVTKVVDSKTKQLQRELSQYQKEKSMKGLTRQQRVIEGERRSELTPEEYAENFKLDRDLRKKVSDSMKKTAPKKKK